MSLQSKAVLSLTTQLPPKSEAISFGLFFSEQWVSKGWQERAVVGGRGPWCGQCSSWQGGQDWGQAQRCQDVQAFREIRAAFSRKGEKGLHMHRQTPKLAGPFSGSSARCFKSL